MIAERFKGAVPEDILAQTEEFLKFVESGAEKNKAAFAGGFLDDCSCYWDWETAGVYMTFPAERADERLELSLNFSEDRRLREVGVCSMPRGEGKYYDRLRTIGALAVTYLDPATTFSDALARIDELARKQPLREKIGATSVHFMVDTGDVNATIIEVRRG